MKRVIHVQCCWLLLISDLLAGLAAGQATATGPSRNTKDLSELRLAEALSRSFRHALRVAEPSTVAIRTVGRAPTPHAAENQSDDYDFGNATGVIVDRHGGILTNYHVVDDAEAVFVRLFDGREFDVSEVRADPWSDLALLYVQDADNLPEARLGDSENVKLGNWVITVGNSFGLGTSVNPGTISAVGRKLPDTNVLLLQTNATMSPGNSGGPLLNVRGEVVGITEGSYGLHDGFEGVGFAIPSNVVKSVVRQLRENGQVRWPYFGARFENLSPDVARSVELLSEQKGVILTRISTDSPAARAGLAVGDVITHFRGIPVHDAIGFHRLIEQSEPQDPVDIEVLRNGQSLKRQAQLEFKPRTARRLDLDFKPTVDKPGANAYVEQRLGLALTDLTDEKRTKMGIKNDIEGAYISDVLLDSAAGFHGIRRGMIVARVGNEPVRTVDEFKKALMEQSIEKGVLLLFCSPFGEHFVVLRPEPTRAINWSIPAGDE